MPTHDAFQPSPAVPSTEPGRAPTSAVPEGAVAVPRGQEALDACLATGAHRGEALVLMAMTHGRDVALPFLLKALDPKGPNAVVAFLDGISRLDPDLARMGLDGWGRNRRVEGPLDLEDLPWVVTLPDGLDLQGRLSVRWCPDWDGRIPEGVRVRGAVHTAEHPQGIALELWRSLHPQGERHLDPTNPIDPTAGLPGWD